MRDTFERLKDQLDLPADAGDDAYLFRRELMGFDIGDIEVPSGES